MAKRLPRVRDVDPQSLLGAHPHDQALQPYIPRDVDVLLDRALAKPGLVLVVHESGSGVRRSAYEALLRSHPDHYLALTNQVTGAAISDAPTDAVLWVDVRSGHSNTATTDMLGHWLTPGRRAIVIISNSYPQLSDLRKKLGTLSPKVVEVSNRLSDTEQSAARKLDDEFTGGSVEDLIDTASAAPQGQPGPHAAGYHADTDEGQDWLDITQDVHMLADLVVSRHVEPPLSIGLFGNWGSGKSFFMRQMRARIKTLAKASADEEQVVGRRGRTVSTYCSTVRQITFNAWHYTEANLWASLATHIFDDLASDTSEEVLKRRIKELAKLRDKEHSLLKQLSMVRLERILVAAQQESKPVFPELTSEDFAWVAQQTGTTTENVQKSPRSCAGSGARCDRHGSCCGATVWLSPPARLGSCSRSRCGSWCGRQFGQCWLVWFPLSSVAPR